jgi:acyl-CoA thioesterase I
MIQKVIFFLGLLLIVATAISAYRVIRLRASVTSTAKYWIDNNAKTSGSYLYVALGDSAAQGIGASKPDKGYVGQIAQKLRDSGKDVRVMNLSVSGAKITDVINVQLPAIKALQPSLVTIEIGANDIADFDAAKFTAEFETLAAALPDGSLVSNLPYFGGIVRADDKVTKANESIASIVASHNLVLVDLYKETKEHDSFRNYAADWFHPNNRGYQSWTTAFWKEI